MDDAEDTQVLKDASKAAARIKRGAHLSDWFDLAAGLVIGQRQCLRETGANDRNNKRYQNCFNAWMDAHPWSRDFDQTTRSHAVWLIENRDAVMEFLAPLASNQSQRMNHPSTVKRAFDKATKVPVEKEPKEKKSDLRIAELEQQLEEANEKIVSLETIHRDESLIDKLHAADQEIATLRDKLFDAEKLVEQFKSVEAERNQQLERLRSRFPAAPEKERSQ
jgi:hypothetical protein